MENRSKGATMWTHYEVLNISTSLTKRIYLCESAKENSHNKNIFVFAQLNQLVVFLAWMTSTNKIAENVWQKWVKR